MKALGQIRPKRQDIAEINNDRHAVDCAEVQVFLFTASFRREKKEIDREKLLSINCIQLLRHCNALHW